MEIRGASAAESAADPCLGSSSLSPRNPTPGPGHRNRPGECQESSRRFCSPFCGFSPPRWDVRGALGATDETTWAVALAVAVAVAAGEGRQWYVEAIWADGKTGVPGMAHCWEGVREGVSHPGRSRCRSASTTKIRSFIFVTAPKADETQTIPPLPEELIKGSSPPVVLEGEQCVRSPMGRSRRIRRQVEMISTETRLKLSGHPGTPTQPECA